MNSKLRYAPYIASLIIIMSWVPMLNSVLEQLNWEVTLCTKVNYLIILGFGLWAFSCTYLLAPLFIGFSHNPKPHIFSLLPLNLALLTHLILFLMADSLLVAVNYYNLRATIPLALLFVSQLIPTSSKNIKPLYRIVIYVTVIQWSIPLFQFTPWILSVGVEYLVFGILFFELLYRKLGSLTEALAYAVLSLLAVGFIYELPISFQETVLFGLSYPLILRSSVIAIILVVYKLGVRTFQKPLVLAGMLGLIMFGIYFHFNPWFYASLHVEWLPRLPTFIFWALALGNMRK